MDAVEERLLKAVIATWRHIEKCSPRYTDDIGYHWMTGDQPCPDPQEDERVRQEEWQAWRAYRQVHRE